MTKEQMKIGAKVRVMANQLGGKPSEICTIIGLYENIDGGVILDRTIDGLFRSWNIDALELVQEAP